MDLQGHHQETKIFYYLDDQDTPYSSKLPIPPEKVTLKHFKSILPVNNAIKGFKFFFRAEDELVGEVKEEVKDDDAKVPVFKGRVVAWVTAISADGSNVSSGSSSQVTEVSGMNRQNGRKPIVHNNGHPNQLQSLPTGFRGGHHGYRQYEDFDDSTTTCTDETDSVISSRCPRRHHKHHRNCGCDSVSSIDSTSYVDSDEDSDDDDSDSDLDESASRISTTTADTSVSRIQFRRGHHRRRRARINHDDDTSSVSSVTDSTMSMNIISVTLTLDAVSFLGISLVGQPNRGIFVGNIMEGGAVALDGRIEPGDMILKVNEKNLESLSNDEAVKILREATSSPGSIRLEILKMWNHSSRSSNFAIPRSEPVRPIDPGAWVAHTEAARAAGEYPLRPDSVSTMRSNGSSSMGGSCVTDHQRLIRGVDDSKILLSVDMEMVTIAKSMAAFDSGLDVREREWLKLKIPNAFYGSDVVDWLFTHLQGFQERREAKKYAAEMLKAGYLKHVYKKGFSEQSFYTFGDEILSCMEGINRLRLDAEEQQHLGGGYHYIGPHRRTTTSSDQSSSDRDTLLLAPGRENGHKHHHHHHHHHHSNHSSPIHSGHGTESATYTEPTGITSTVASSSGFLPWGNDAVHYGIFGGHPPGISAHLSSRSSSSETERSQMSGPLPAGVSSFKGFQPNNHTTTFVPANTMSPAHIMQQHQQSQAYQNQHQYAEPTYVLSGINNGTSNGISVGNGVSCANKSLFETNKSSSSTPSSNGRVNPSSSQSIENMLKQTEEEKLAVDYRYADADDETIV